MFKFFLNKRLGEAESPQQETRATSRRNRRVFDRFSIEYKHLMMMNDHDILSIREISSKGFSTKVGPRSFERFKVGDTYPARMRYLGEMFDLESKVSWKSGVDTVGFELVKADKRTLEFMQRLLHPIELANSLRRVDAKFMAEVEDGKIWYHGDSGTDLYVWAPSLQGMERWELTTKESFTAWEQNNGLRTGRIVETTESASSVLDLTVQQQQKQFDTQANPSTIQFAVDLMMASEIEERDQILSTLVSK